MKTTELNKIRKQLTEDIGFDASNMEKNHEIQMARADCYFAAKNAIAIHQLLEKLADSYALEPWIKEKISAATDTIKSIKEHLEYSLMSNEIEPQIGGVEDLSILALGEDASAGGTSSGGIATVPAGKKKKPIRREDVIDAKDRFKKSISKQPNLKGDPVAQAEKLNAFMDKFWKDNPIPKGKK